MLSSTSGSSWCRARQKRGRWVLRATDPRALHGPSWLSFLLPPEDEDDDEEEEEDSLHMARGCSSRAGSQAGSRARGTHAAPLQQHRGERGSEGDPAGTPLPPSGTSPPCPPPPHAVG